MKCMMGDEGSVFDNRLLGIARYPGFESRFIVARDAFLHQQQLRTLLRLTMLIRITVYHNATRRPRDETLQLSPPESCL